MPCCDWMFLVISYLYYCANGYSVIDSKILSLKLILFIVIASSIEKMDFVGWHFSFFRTICSVVHSKTLIESVTSFLSPFEQFLKDSNRKPAHPEERIINTCLLFP